MEPTGGEAQVPVTHGIDAVSTALIIVDMQNYFCHPNGPMQRRGDDISANRLAAEKIAALLPELRARVSSVIYFRQIVNSKRIERARSRRGLASVGSPVRSGCEPGDWAFEILEELRPAHGDIVINKPHYSGFVGTALDAILGRAGISTLIMTGTAANVCVDTTVRDADSRGLRVIVGSDLVGYTQKALGEAALENFERYFAEVASGQEIIGALRAAMAGDP